MPSLVVIGPQMKEKQWLKQCPPPPAYMVLKDPSLNRVNGCHHVGLSFCITSYLHLMG